MSSKTDEPVKEGDSEANRKRKGPEEDDGEDSSSTRKTQKLAAEKEKEENVTMIEFRFKSMPPFHYTYAGYMHIPMIQDPKTGALSLPKLTPETNPINVPVAFTWPPDLRFEKEKAAFPKERFQEMKKVYDDKNSSLEDDQSDEFKRLCFQHNSIVAKLVPVTMENEEVRFKWEEDVTSKEDERKPAPTKLKWSLQLGVELLGSNTFSACVPPLQHSSMEVIQVEKNRADGLCAHDLDEWVSKAGGELIFAQPNSDPSYCEFYFTLSEERPGEDTWKEELRNKKQGASESATASAPQWSKLKDLLKTQNSDWSEDEVETRLAEYKRYMALCILKRNEKQADDYKGDDDIDELSPSPQVDEVWHCHLLFADQYRRDIEAYASQISEKPALIRHEAYLDFNTRPRYQRVLDIFEEEDNVVECLNKIVGSERAASCWPDADDAYEEAGGGCG